jgi:hypothetical protein
VPDPGPAYWDRFNARVTDRIKREADGPGVAVLRPKRGWVRQQLRYLVPAAAAAALVVMVVRYGGMQPGAPQAPPNEQVATATREERDRLADRSMPSGNEVASQDRAAAAPAVGEPSPPQMTFQRAPDGQGWPSAGAGRDATGSVAPAAGSPPVAAADGMPSRVEGERKKLAGAAAPMAERQGAGKAESASGTRVAKEPSTGSTCEQARALAERERIREAEVAQRACLAQDRSATAQEKGLVFLAELLDRQARFSEADAVIAEVDRQFPQSRPLDLYRRQRPMVQKQPGAVPVTR